ncbi:FtsH protease activity modulator HflK [Marinicella sp. W31]|uniref:FtsH protease activity modulator HflK n=1 Tax=Marinicella sp. W31 TaxID=3023713 RepID=UPI0037565644
MAWNEPGNNKPGGKKPDNPFGSGGNKPPDLEKIVSDFFKSLKRTFGGGPGGGFTTPVIFLFFAVVALGVYSSVYRINESERGVVLVFGKYSHTLKPGLNFTWPRPVASVYRVNVTNIRQENNSGDMLTEDKNLVEIDYSVQYQIKENEVNNFLFNLIDPQNTVKQAAESAIRQVVGTSSLDQIMNENITSVLFEVQTELQNMLDEYKSGIRLKQFNITKVQPPTQVNEAFNDVVKAREDQKTFINQANQYAKAVIPEAEGRVLKIRQEAEAYKEAVISEASGKAQRFDLLRTEYEIAPEVTRKRLYLEMMEKVLGDSPKVVIDSNNSNNMMYLPLDQLMKPKQQNREPVLDLGTTYVSPDSSQQNMRREDGSRGRSGRGN